MTGTDDKDGATDSSAIENLTGAYALDAVTDEERAAVERALDGSEALRAEVGELADTASALAAAVEPVEPSAALKASIFAMLDATPQLPRAAADAHAAADAAPGAVVDPAPEAAIAPGSAPATAAGPATAAERRAQVRWFRRPLVIAAGAAAAAALVVGTLVLPTVLSSPPQDPFQVVAAAPDAETVISTMDDGAQVTLVWSGELALAAVAVDGMPPLPETNDYELWFIGADGPRSAGVIAMNDAGDGSQQLVGEMAAGESIGITIEPAGGSPQPTTDPILVVATT